MKTRVLQLALFLSLSLAGLQLKAISLTALASPGLPIYAECDGGSYHYLLYRPTGMQNNITYLDRFDGTTFYTLDSFTISPNGYVYCMEYDNNEIYIGGGFDTVNNVPSPGVFKYSLSTKTITPRSALLPVQIDLAEVHVIKRWNNQLLMGGIFRLGGATYYTPLIIGSGSYWTPFDNAVFSNGTHCTLSNRLFQISVVDSSSFYIAGAFTLIDQLAIHEVAYFHNGQWSAVGNGLPHDMLYGSKTGLVEYDGKLFAAHEDSSSQWLISYFDGNTWATLAASVSSTFSLATGSCGLFAINTDNAIFPGGVAQYDNQLGFTTPTGIIPNFYNLFEHAGNMYVLGDYRATNSSTNYHFAKVECIPQNVGLAEIEETAFIYPNPFSNQLRLRLSDKEPVSIVLYDCLSRPVCHQLFTSAANINTEQLEQGIYFYELRTSEGTFYSGKVIKE